MPITINDCKCGKIATVSPSALGWEFALGCRSCIEEGKAEWIEIIFDDDFVEKVAEWNAANPRRNNADNDQ